MTPSCWVNSQNQQNLLFYEPCLMICLVHHYPQSKKIDNFSYELLMKASVVNLYTFKVGWYIFSFKYLCTMLLLCHILVDSWNLFNSVLLIEVTLAMVKLTCPRSISLGICHSLGIEPWSRNLHSTSSIIKESVARDRFQVEYLFLWG